MKAVILAGGVGTRLRPLTYVMPKCLLPVGGMPLLEYSIRWLKSQGISEFVVCVAYLKWQVITSVGDGQRLGVKLEYAEAESPMGTAGQLKTAEPFIGDETFLAMNGDIVTSLNVVNLMKLHEQRGGMGTLALKTFDVKVPYGHITADGGLISKFEEKPTLHLMANAGVYVLNKKIFESIPAGVQSSLETDIFPALLARGERLNSYYEEAYWNDVGTMVDFEKVNDELLSMQTKVGANAHTS